MPHNAWKQQEAVQEPPDLQEAEESPGPQHITQQEIRAVLDQLEGRPDAEAHTAGDAPSCIHQPAISLLCTLCCCSLSVLPAGPDRVTLAG